MQSNIEIGKRIEQLRTKKGLTQLELAKILKIKRETISQWENGSRDLKSGYIIALADVLGTNCDYILRGIETKNIEASKQTGLNDDSLSVLEQYKNVSSFGYPNHEEDKKDLIRWGSEENRKGTVDFFKQRGEEKVKIINEMIKNHTVGEIAENIACYMKHLSDTIAYYKRMSDAFDVDEWVDCDLEADKEYKIARCYLFDTQESLMKFVRDFCKEEEEQLKEIKKEVYSSCESMRFEKEGEENGNDN